jgi:hypothetical protein
MPRAQGCAGAAGGISDLHGVRTGMNGTSRVSTWMCDAKPFSLAGHNYERYAAGAGMRTTAGMQEVGQRRSSCRGAAGGISDLHGVRTGMNGTSRVSTWMCDAKPFRLAGHNYERYAAGAPVGGIGAAGRDCFGVVQNLDNRTA